MKAEKVLIEISRETSLRLFQRVIKEQDNQIYILDMDRVITDLLDIARSEGQ